MTAALMTVEEAAAALHATVTVAAIRAAIREKRLAAVRLGRRYYISEKDLRRFASCPAPASPRVSGGAKTAHGSSSTVGGSTGQATAERAAEDLLKMLSATTSQPGSRPGRRGQRSPAK